MTVVISKEDLHCPGNEHNRFCSSCGKPASVPFVYWYGHREIIFCNACCDDGSLGNGLLADIIQTTAIVEMHRLGYRQFTLERKLTTEVEAEDRAKRKRIGLDDKLPF